MKSRHTYLIGIALLAALIVGCNAFEPKPKSTRSVERVTTKDEPDFLDVESPEYDEEAFRALSSPADATTSYRLGPSDVLEVTVIGQPTISGRYTIGPDGAIAVPLCGTLDLRGKTRDEATALLAERLAPFFSDTPSAWVEVAEYHNNKCYVLGRVERPGMVELTGGGRLLQVIAEAGGLPVREFRSFLARCAIIRGSDAIIWIDLLDLLQRGNMALNIPVWNGDVVYIPDSEDTIVFVMGEVNTPGAVPIKVRLTVTQALALSGGTTEDADLRNIYLVRDSSTEGGGKPVRIDFERLLETGDFRSNLELKSGDILYVSRRGMGDLNYVLRKLAPAISAVALGAAVAD